VTFTRSIRSLLCRWGVWCPTCDHAVHTCDCPASLRRMHRRIDPRAILMFAGNGRMDDDGANPFGIKPAGRLPAVPHRPRDGDAAAELRNLQIVLMRLVEDATREDRRGLSIALAQVRAACYRAGVL
jgi:hypothetical protein